MEISLPRDDAYRDDQLIQWWYWTGHLNTASGRAFGVEVVFFSVDPEAISECLDRFKEEHLIKPHGLTEFVGVQMIHHAISDITGKQFKKRVDFVPWLPKKLDGAFELSTLLGHITAKGGGGNDELHGVLSNSTIDLKVKADRPAVLHYDGKNHAYSFGGNTYYYSREKMSATGTLVFDGESHSVTGTLWFDRQYGDLAFAVLQGWQWFALQLADDTQIMLFDFRTTVSERYGSISNASETRVLGPSDYAVEVLEHWQSPNTEINYPSKWKVLVDDRELYVAPLVADQEFDEVYEFPKYWEGACSITDSAGNDVGNAYVELTGFPTGKSRP